MQASTVVFVTQLSWYGKLLPGEFSLKCRDIRVLSSTSKARFDVRVAPGVGPLRRQVRRLYGRHRQCLKPGVGCVDREAIWTTASLA
jgi:hypothetical protein